MSEWVQIAVVIFVALAITVVLGSVLYGNERDRRRHNYDRCVWRLIRAARATLAEERREVPRGVAPDLDELEDALEQLERE